MVDYQIQNAVKFSTLLFLFLVFVVDVFGQSKCVSDDEVKKIVDRINSQKTAAFNKNLQQELLQIKQNTARIYEEMSRLPNDSQQLEARLSQQKEKNAANLCQVLRQYGWASKAAVGAEASDIASSVFLDSLPLESQKQLIPIIEAAFKVGEISKSNYAKMVDQFHIRSGQKQIFGTVIGISKDLLLLYPIQNEAAVDQLRRQYELPPLAEQIRRFEQQYQAVVIKPPSSLRLTTQSQQREIKLGLTTSGDEKDEIIKVETNLVNLNATVIPEKPGMIVPPLRKEDFSIIDNGREQPVEFFAATQVPFDITLLIDISGSTANKIKLIRKTTRSFIKAARPSDRISIAVFDEAVTIISPLTEDRESLLASVDKIKSGGGSKVWDALAVALAGSATLQNANPQNREQRRSGIVFMTDGADNSFATDAEASSITFADLLEKVRRSSTLVVPIHLDTREDYGLSEKLYYGTRRALNLLADESGGLFYEARKYEDLENVYEQVLNDLSRVYSIGYSPSNTDSTSVWRAVKLNIKNHPNLIVRSRNGYYAR